MLLKMSVISLIRCCRATGKPSETSPTDSHNVREMASLFPCSKDQVLTFLVTKKYHLVTLIVP